MTEMALSQAWNEGSLLKRTLVHVGSLTLGAFAFVALMSFILVTAAQAIFPSHAPKSAPAAETPSKGAELETPDSKIPLPAKLPKSRRASKDTISEEENPNKTSDR